MHSLEATSDDVATALDRLGVNGYANDLAERWLDYLDLEEAMGAADACAGDMDDQTDALVSNLEQQLRALGAPEKTPEALAAEEASEALDADLSPATSAVRGLRL